MKQKLLILVIMLLAAAAASGCVRSQPDIIVITATFAPSFGEPGSAPVQPTPVPDMQQTLFAGAPVTDPTPDPTRPVQALAGRDYVVQPGDTLFGIAAANGTSLETLLRVNPDLTNPDALEVGQVIRLPDPPTEFTSDFKLLPDSKLVYGPGASGFDIAGFIAQQPGYIRVATDTIDDLVFPAAEVVERVSQEYSVDPRLLLALLEYKSGWLSSFNIPDERKNYPLGVQGETFGFDRSGLYRQLAWAANQLNHGYYGWKLRDWTTLEFRDGTRLLYAPGLNAGSVAVQYVLGLLAPSYYEWQDQVGPNGLFGIYNRYFGSPFAGAVEPVVPPNLQQPEFGLPIPRGQTWYFTGGPHGGWGAGSAWAAIDFAPPDDITTKTSGCYISDYFATALAPGVIARESEGAVVLDLDGDGDETTGWTVLYLHIAAQDRVAVGTRVNVGDPIGRPSCEGGFSNATHMHIARRYNGEWIPADCTGCPPAESRPAFVMNGWSVVGLPNQEYQGFLVKGQERRIAEQGRNTTVHHVSW